MKDKLYHIENLYVLFLFLITVVPMVLEDKLPEEWINAAYDYMYDDEYAFWDDAVYSIPDITHNIWPRINQWMNSLSKSACTIFWAWAQLIRLFWLDLTREKANEIGLIIVNYCVDKGWYTIGQGRGTPMAVKYVTQWWNEIWYKKYNKEKVFYLRMLWNSPLVREVLSKWHMVGYTKTIQWAWDQIYWYVDKKAESYKKMTWHRLNLKWPEYLDKATWWATRWEAEWASQDNYFEQIGTNFFIKDLWMYINKWVYSYVYIILPESAMWTENSIEEEKKKIAEQKAVDALIWSLSTTRWSLPEKFQKKVSVLASELREEYPDARQLIWDEQLKHYQSIVDQLSFNWKWADENDKESYALLAKTIREKHWVE